MMAKRGVLHLARPMALIVAGLALGVGPLIPQPSADAQDAAGAGYKWDTIGAEYVALSSLNAQKGLKDQIILGNAGFGANRPAIDNWYRQYLFPSMATENLMGEIGEKRESLARDLEMAKDPALHQYLTDLTYDEMTRRISENYHPFVKYNAMLVIGLNLNLTEKRPAERLPAVRLPKAFDFLFDELRKPDQSDAMRTAAMVGIERHARLLRFRPQDQPIPDGQRAELATLMHTLLNEKTPPAGRDANTQVWFRRRAADILGEIGLVGDNRAIFDSLVKIVGDAEEPLSMRCTAAKSLGRLNYTNVTGIDPLATSRQLGALAAQACRVEETRAKDEQKKLAEEPGQARSGGMMGGMGGLGGLGGGTGLMPGGSGGGMMPGGGMAGPGAPEGPSAGSSGGSGGGLPGMGGGSGGMYPGMGMGRGPQDPTSDDLLERARRRLKVPLASVLIGISGASERITEANLKSFAQLADPQQKAEIMKIIGALNELVKATDNTESGLDGLLKSVRSKNRDLEKLLPNLTAKPESDVSDDAALPGAGPPPKPPADTDPAKPAADAGAAKG